MRPDTRAALLIPIALAALLDQPKAAAVSPPAASWIYDRLTWNPGGDTLAVQAFLESPEGPTTAWPLLVPLDPSAQVTVAPEVRAVQVSSEGDAALVLGDHGLWQLEIVTGRLTQVHFQPPASTERLTDFAFRKDGAGVLFLTGAAGDPKGAMYRWEPGTPVVRVAGHKPGSAPPPEWTREAVPPTAPNVAGMRSARRVTVPGSPPLSLDYDGRRLTIDTGYAGSRAELDQVTVAWAAWPPGGQRLLVSVEELAGDGAKLLEATAGGGIRLLLEARTVSGGWLDERAALVHSVDGRLY
ncbi:MAG: hypothetical protein FD129_1440, partial [bacterium]